MTDKESSIKCIMQHLAADNPLNNPEYSNYQTVAKGLKKLTATEANCLAVMLICKEQDREK